MHYERTARTEKLFIDSEDQCMECTYFNTGVMCPLLEALATNVVRLNDESDEQDGLFVQNCNFFVPFARHLKLVPPVQ